jgi:hypothetical protein
MAEASHVHNLSELLETLEGAGDGNSAVSIADIRERLGVRSFGPFLLMIGLIGATPASGIPVFPTIIGVTVLLTAGQMVIGLRKIWLPETLLDRSISRDRLVKAIGFLRWPAGIIDKIVRPRLTFLTDTPASRILAACCCLIALTTPPLEFIPATSAIPAAIIAIFGLAITTHDGFMAILALIAFGMFVLGLFFLGSNLLG